jgi:hypothetical protein
MLSVTTGEGAALASVRSVAVGSASNCDGGTVIEGAALPSVPSFDVGSASHCEGGRDMRGSGSGTCSLGRRGFSRPL